MNTTFLNHKEIKDIVGERIQELINLNKEINKVEHNLFSTKVKYEERKKAYIISKENIEERDKAYFNKYQVRKLIIKEFLSENNYLFCGDNDNNMSNSQDDAQKGLLNKLLTIKEKINKKIDLINSAENELINIESKTNAKLEKISDSEREEYQQYKKDKLDGKKSIY